MLTIRLQRTGTKNAASFRIVVAEKSAHVSKKFHEVLGSYNPSSKGFVIKNPERLQYWITQNIQISPTVHNMLVTKGLLKADKVKAFNIPKKKEEPKAEVAPAPVAVETPTPAVEEKPAEPEVAAEAPVEAEKPAEVVAEPTQEEPKAAEEAPTEELAA